MGPELVLSYMFNLISQAWLWLGLAWMGCDNVGWGSVDTTFFIIFKFSLYAKFHLNRLTREKCVIEFVQ